MKDSPCLDRDLFVPVTISTLRHGFTTGLVFGLRPKDIVHTRIVKIRGAVSYRKDRSQICFKAFSPCQSLFLYIITLPGSTSFIWTKTKLSKYSMWCLCQFKELSWLQQKRWHLAQYKNCWAMGIFCLFFFFLAKYLESIVAIKCLFKIILQHIATMSGTRSPKIRCTLSLHLLVWIETAGWERNVDFFYFSDTVWHICILASILKICSSPVFSFYIIFISVTCESDREIEKLYSII